MLAVISALAAILLLLLALKLSQRLTLRLKVLAGVTVSRQPQKSCPHLGHASDPFNHGSSPADEHRCYLYMQRDRIDLLHQKSFCLSTAHHKCPWLMIRRPDAPPSLGVRLRGLLVGGPRQTWGYAFSLLRRVPSLAANAGGVLRVGARALDRGVVQLARAIRAVAGDLDRAIGRLARAIGAVGRDGLHVLNLAVSRLARALKAVGGDIWALSQRSGTLVSFAARAVRLSCRGLWWLLRAPIRGLVFAVHTLRGVATASAARRRAVREERAAAMAVAPPVVTPLEPSLTSATFEAAPAELAGLAELFPGLEPAQLPAEPVLPFEPLLPAEFPAAPELPVVSEPVAEPVLASAAHSEPSEEVITQRLEVPLARFEELVARLEGLLSDGVAALDRGQESLAYQLFLKATEQPTKLADKAAPELQSMHTSLMTRAWFWRAKTAETVDEVVDTLDQALRYEPDNLQIQAHLAWARQRLDREKHVEEGTAAALQPVGMTQLAGVRAKRPSLLATVGVGIRILGGLMALALAALWMTTGVMPALGRFLTQLPAGDEQLIRRMILTLNATALPGQGHLPLPMLNYDLGLSLPFVLAFLFVFTARGLMDGDGWARTTGLLLAGAGGWLCAAAVSNPDASHLGLALCVGIIIAAVIGRFDSPKVMHRATAGY